jgi:hypothetical protein
LKDDNTTIIGNPDKLGDVIQNHILGRQMLENKGTENKIEAPVIERQFEGFVGDKSAMWDARIEFGCQANHFFRNIYAHAGRETPGKPSGHPAHTAAKIHDFSKANRHSVSFAHRQHAVGLAPSRTEEFIWIPLAEFLFRIGKNGP